MLFGPTGSGKSALLAALSKVNDEPAALRRQNAAVFIDSSGAIADEILLHRESLDNSDRGREPIKTLFRADALLMTADASASPPLLESALINLECFLRFLEQTRGERTLVSGLPVYLVLTRCDLLAKPADTPANWLQRVEERKQQARKHFHHFLNRTQGNGENKLSSGPAAFGRIVLHLHATAVKRPKLSGNNWNLEEPYGVADLLEYCLASAWAYRRQRVRSSRRLFVTVFGSICLVLLMGLLAAVLFAYRQRDVPSQLEIQVDRYRVRTGELSPQASYRNVKAKIKEVKELQEANGFDKLPEDKRRYVEDRLHQLLAYETFEAAVNAIPDPRYGPERALEGIQQALRHAAELAEGHPDWSETEAGQRLAELRDDLNALTATIKKTKDDYLELIKEANLIIETKDEGKLGTRVTAVLRRARELPNPKDDGLRPIPGSRRIDFGMIFRFDSVVSTWEQWQDVKSRLETLPGLPKS